MKNSELFLPHGSALPFSKRHENISGFLDPLTLLPQANIEIATPFVIQRNYSTWRSWGIRCSNVSCQSNVKQQMRTFIYGIALMEKSVPNHLNRILAFQSLRWCMHARFWLRCWQKGQIRRGWYSCKDARRMHRFGCDWNARRSVLCHEHCAWTPKFSEVYSWTCSSETVRSELAYMISYVLARPTQSPTSNCFALGDALFRVRYFRGQDNMRSWFGRKRDSAAWGSSWQECVGRRLQHSTFAG